jgi:hypothetical protein
LLYQQQQKMQDDEELDVDISQRLMELQQKQKSSNKKKLDKQ